jgi:hypothetical protein
LEKSAFPQSRNFAKAEFWKICSKRSKARFCAFETRVMIVSPLPPALADLS